jgi:hypothetical protein
MLMHDFVELVHAVAWPVVALTALLLLRADLSNLIERVGEFLRRTKTIKAKGPFGIALDLAAEIAQRGIPGPEVEGSVSRQEFETLAAEYRVLKVASYSERVAARRRLSDRLGALVLALDLDRNELSSGHEGERVAFATASLIMPKQGDIGRLLIAASTKSSDPESRLYRFTGYRIVLALTPQITGASKRQLEKAEKTLEAVERNAVADEDSSLQALIDRTRAVIEEARQG